MTETGNTIIKKKLASLPEYSPDDNFWNVIEARLDFEKKLSDKIRELPHRSPADKLWTGIEEKIESQRVRRMYSRYRYYAASIAVILVSSAILTFRLIDKRSHEVQITTEIIYSGTPVENVKSRWPKPVQYINSLCKLNSMVCNSPRFVEKKLMLEELDKDEQEILRFEEQFGSSETLEKSKIRIERVRAEVIKELLQMIEG